MQTIRIRLDHFWPGFGIEDFRRRFPFLHDRYRLELSSRPDVVFYSCFENGHKQPRPPVPSGPGIKVFYCAENLRPDLSTCDYALSFCRDIDSDRHLRFPNYVQRLYRDGLSPEALLRGNDDLDAILARKDRFCAFLQSHDVAERNGFVRELSRARPVDCLGACLNPSAERLPANQTLSFLARYRFVIAFENEVRPGYVTEKIVQAMLSRTIPLYLGDPTVEEDFNPGSFLDRRHFKSDQEFIEEILCLDEDWQAYRAVLAQPYYHRDQIPEHCDEERFRVFFDRIFDAALAARERVADRPGALASC